MAYTGPVGIMPGAATEKLPFVHSNFKPSSKISKCLFGFKKLIGHANVSHREYKNQKLPQIYYSGFDAKNSNTAYHKGRMPNKTRYAGFTGGKKLSKKKDSRLSDEENSNSGSLDQQHRMKPYLSLPNLTALHKSGGNNNMVHYSSLVDNDEKRRQTFYEFEEEERRFPTSHGNKLDSLIFCDEDEPESQHDGRTSGRLYNNYYQHSSVKFRDIDYLRDSPHQLSPDGHEGEMSQVDILAKGVEEKLRVARGKSGMKRGKRREPDHARMLGDVITAQRLEELLKPRKVETASLQFE